jgi:hypothetical protein
MSEENRNPPAAQWGRPLRKKSRGPVATPTPSGPPAIGPVETPAPAGGDDTTERASAYHPTTDDDLGPIERDADLGPIEAFAPAAPEMGYESDEGHEPRAPREPYAEREPHAARAPRVAAEADDEDMRERDLVVFMARGLVDHPDDVSVDILSPGPDASFELHVHQDDLGHVIGKQGRTARSLRLALGAAAGRVGRRAELEIAD